MEPTSVEKQFAELYPSLSPKELEEATHNFKRYIEVVSDIVREKEEATSKHAIGDRGRSQE
jgi:hypothetical protein